MSALCAWMHLATHASAPASTTFSANSVPCSLCSEGQLARPAGPASKSLMSGHSTPHMHRIDAEKISGGTQGSVIVIN